MHCATSSEWVEVLVSGVRLEGELEWPLSPAGLVVFVRSQSGRATADERALARAIHDAQIATLVVDFLVPVDTSVDAVMSLRRDVALLAERLVGLLDWVKSQARLERLPTGLLATGVGTAAALLAAARRHDAVRAVVSNGGSPDLAKDHLRDVRAPTLLIVGERDHEGLRIHAEAARALGRIARVEALEGATQVAGEPGVVDAVGRLATDWFALNFAAGRAAVHPPLR